MSNCCTELLQDLRSSLPGVLKFLVVGLCFAFIGRGNATVIDVSTVYYVDDTLSSVLSSDSSTGLSLTTAGSLTSPSGSTMSGLAGFANGRFFGASTLTRAAAVPISEVLTSATSFRDTFVVDTNGRCRVGGPACQLRVSYTATGTFSATGDLPFAGQLDFGVLNPDTPGDRSTWLVDRPVFLTPGQVRITDMASVSFFDNEPFVFWPTFGVVARQTAGSNGQSALDFSHSFIFDGLSVTAPQGEAVSFSFESESGLTYEDVSQVPEPSSFFLATSGLALAAFMRNRKAR